MHTEKQEIFDRYAQTLGLKEITDFEDILSSFKSGGFTFPEFLDVIFEACDLVQKEQQKRIAENEKQYWIYDGIENEFDKYESLQEIKEHITETCIDETEGIHPDIESILILKKASEVKVIEDGEFYKVEFEDSILSENNLIK